MSFNPYGSDRDISPGQQAISQSQYTARTFAWMFLGLMITFAVAIICWMTNATLYAMGLIPGIQIIALIAVLVISITTVSRIEKMKVSTAKSLFIAFSALYGFVLSMYFYRYRVGSLIFAFLATAVYFGALAAYGHFTKSDLSFMRPILISGLLFLIVFGVLSWFIPAFSAFDRVMCLVGIAVFLGCTAYDTQRIRGFYNYYSGHPEMLEKASIYSALQLYLDFINLFLYLLRFLGKRN